MKNEEEEETIRKSIASGRTLKFISLQPLSPPHSHPSPLKRKWCQVYEMVMKT
jgi:hypothetical protein